MSMPLTGVPIAETGCYTNAEYGSAMAKAKSGSGFLLLLDRYEG